MSKLKSVQVRLNHLSYYTIKLLAEKRGATEGEIIGKSAILMEAIDSALKTNRRIEIEAANDDHWYNIIYRR